MSILSNIFSSGATELVKGVGGIIDDLHTSKEEKLAAELKIKELIKNEDSDQPLSDKALSILLKDEGIQVARRTIAKYRIALKILPSNQRKNI